MVFWATSPPAPSLPVAGSDGSLLLRPFQLRDAPAYASHINTLLSDPNMPGFLLTFRAPYSARLARERIRQSHAWARQNRGWALAIDWDGTLIGQAQIVTMDRRQTRAEIAYWLAPTHQGRGLAHAAMDTLIQAAANHWPITQVEATVSADNQASIRLLHRLGFAYINDTVVPYRVQGSWRRRRARVQVYGRPARPNLSETEDPSYDL